MKKSFYICFLSFCLLNIVSFADIDDNYSFGKDIFVNGINCNEIQFSQNIVAGDEFIYFPLDIDFLGNLGVFPLWNKEFDNLYISSIGKTFVSVVSEDQHKSDFLDVSQLENRDIKIFIDGESRNTEAVFNKQNGLYYAPVDDFVLNKLGWHYYDYGIGGKYIYTYKPQENDFEFMKKNLEYYNLLGNKMMQVNRKLERDRANYYIKLIKGASDKYEIDQIWITAMIWQESNFEEDCEYKGATGLMQMLVSTGKTMGLTREDLLNPEKISKSCQDSNV